MNAGKHAASITLEDVPGVYYSRRDIRDGKIRKRKLAWERIKPDLVSSFKVYFPMTCNRKLVLSRN